MSSQLDNLQFYQRSRTLFDLCWDDCEILSRDFRGKEVARQLIRSCGSIAANIEEGYGRGEGKQFVQFLRISRGSAQESRGWYLRSEKLLPTESIHSRVDDLNQIIAMLSSSIMTLESKNQKK